MAHQTSIELDEKVITKVTVTIIYVFCLPVYEDLLYNVVKFHQLSGSHYLIIRHLLYILILFLF